MLKSTIFFMMIWTLISMILMISCKNGNVDSSKNSVPLATEFHPLATNHTSWSLGQVVYVPVYSSIYLEHQNKLLHLTATLSIRNTSNTESIIISKVEYYDTNGKLIKNFIDGNYVLGKMATKDFVIPTLDLKGGTGANFIVEWKSINKVSLPIMETVMLGAEGTLGFSFTSRGQEIESF